MTRSLEAFAERLEKKADRVETAGSRLAVIGAMAAVETLVEITPVDTSEHLSNWQVFLNNRAPDAIPPYVPGIRGSTRGASSRVAIAEAQAELAFKKPGQHIWISNLAPAIAFLDAGGSRQFAGGFVPRAVIAFRNAVERARKGVLGL